MALRATITNYAQAAAIVKEMKLEGGLEADDWRSEGRSALKRILEERMETYMDSRLADIRWSANVDRRNGTYVRHLLTELGELELSVPRSRTTTASAVLRAYARRTVQIDRLVMGCFVFGLSTRKVGEALLAILGERISPSTVSRVAKTLDEAVATFHRRRLRNDYKVILLDGVVLRRRTGAGAISRPVLVVMGIRRDGKKEMIDFRLRPSESREHWESFLTDLYNRGLTCEGVDMVCVDGGQGLLSALENIHPDIPLQRCWAHKVRNITDKVRMKDREEVKRDLRKVHHAKNVAKAKSAARDFADKWEGAYPAAVRCLKNDLDDLFTFFRFNDETWHKATRTTNAIERRLGRCGEERDQWACLVTEPVSNESFTLYSHTKTKNRERLPPLP
jgi:putative transposase